MLSVWRYVLNSLDDLLLFADEDILSALAIVYLVLALIFAHLWASWITSLQQDAFPNLRNQFNATSPVRKLPAKSSETVAQPPPVGLGIFNTWPEGNRPEFSSLADLVSNRSQIYRDAPMESPKEHYIIPNTRNFHGWTVASPPVPYRSYVSFYASSGPSQRGELSSCQLP